VLRHTYTVVPAFCFKTVAIIGYEVFCCISLHRKHFLPTHGSNFCTGAPCVCCCLSARENRKLLSAHIHTHREKTQEHSHLLSSLFSMLAWFQSLTARTTTAKKNGPDNGSARWGHMWGRDEILQNLVKQFCDVS
jgi:hypothetical protein